MSEYCTWIFHVEVFFFIIVLLFLVRGTVEEDGSWMSEWLVFVMCFFFFKEVVSCVFIKEYEKRFLDTEIFVGYDL